MTFPKADGRNERLPVSMFAVVAVAYVRAAAAGGPAVELVGPLDKLHR